MGDQVIVGFGYKNAWLALREVDPDVVVAALGLRDLGTVDWRGAVDLAYLTDDRLWSVAEQGAGSGEVVEPVRGRTSGDARPLRGVAAVPVADGFVRWLGQWTAPTQKTVVNCS